MSSPNANKKNKKKKKEEAAANPGDAAFRIMAFESWGSVEDFADVLKIDAKPYGAPEKGQVPKSNMY
jgi:hypothetical protein